MSSGESSAAAQPAFDPDALTSAGIHLADVALTGTGSPHPSKPMSSPAAAKREASNNATIAEPHRPSGSSSGASSPIYAAIGATILEVGTVLGGRYEIQKLLGMGGMGAVYKAHDLEVDRTVGLKVIRPDLAGNPEVLARFKQELVLARQVTHRNIVRIYDLNEADGVKFITMEFIEGEDLRTILLGEGKLPPKEAVDIMQQACSGLQAAHAEAVIHRDLKPSNIMRDGSGRVVIMDFGLAKTVQSDGMTQTGMMLGTMEYMSPEQAMGSELDARSDLFTMGLIFYELLTGNIPFRAETAIASLVKRTQECAAPLSDVDPTISPGLSLIAAKCLERNLDLRYKSTRELLADLETWQGKPDSAIPGPAPTAAPEVKTRRRPVLVAVVAAIVALLLGGYLLRDKLLPSRTAQISAAPAVSLAILPFRNASGDASLDWLGPSLAEMLSTEVGQSAQLRTVSPARLHEVLQDLRVAPNTSLDPTMLGRIAEFSSADVVVFGQYARFGDQIRIDATLQDLKHNRTVSLKADASSEKDIPNASDRLADSVRQNLALSRDVLKELKASSYQPTSTSVEALRDYDQGLLLLREGQNLQARDQFEGAVLKDAGFALAYARLAQTHSNLGYDAEAELAAQHAVSSSQNLPEAEKYLLVAIQAQITKNFPAAINAYENMAKVSPGNAEVQSALANLYEQSGDFAKAGEANQKILSANPKDINAALAQGRLAIKTDNVQAAIDPLSRALSLSIQLDHPEQKASALHVLAVAYRILEKPEEALRNEQDALAIYRTLGQKRGLATSLNEIARTQVLLGRNKEALPNFEEALQIRRDIGDKRGLGDTLIDLGNFYDDSGDHDQALRMYKESLQLQRDLGNERQQAACLNNIAGVYFAKGEYEDARTYYQQALQLREKSKAPGDIVESVHNLAETSVKMGEYDQAFSLYKRALDLRRSMNDQRGAAIESYTLGMLLDDQGRYGAAIDSKQDALKAFQVLKDRTYWMAEIFGGYAQALIFAGRGEEAMSYLDEALNLSRGLKNDGMVSQTLSFQGDAAYYRGNSKEAGALYEQALQAANRSKEPEKILQAKLNLAKVALQERRAQQALTQLHPLLQQAERLGLKYAALDCSITLAEAMIQSGNGAQAQQELQRVLLQTDKLGLKPLSARAHYLLATSLRGSGKQIEAQQHYREALQLINAMQSDPGAQKLLQRSDLKSMYEEATRGSQTDKG